jgi:hypothetical protein
MFMFWVVTFPCTRHTAFIFLSFAPISNDSDFIFVKSLKYLTRKGYDLANIVGSLMTVIFAENIDRQSFGRTSWSN